MTSDRPHELLRTRPRVPWQAVTGSIDRVDDCAKPDEVGSTRAERRMTSLFVVRAGRTALSSEGRLQGHTDRPLIADGVEDARRAARRLAQEDIVATYTSPLRRAREAAEVIGRSVGLFPDTLQDLADADVGTWVARTATEIRESEPRAFDFYLRFPVAASFPSGERMADVERRAFGALGSIAERHPGRKVVVVTHELLIRLVLVRLKGLEGTALWDPHVSPGSVTELRATDEGLQVPTILEDLFRAAARGRKDPTRG